MKGTDVAGALSSGASEGRPLTRALPEALLADLSECIASRMGLHFPQPRWPELERGLRAAAKEFGFSEPEACGRWLLTSALAKAQVEALASHLTVGETYFFREKRTFEVLEGSILPELIRLRRGSSPYLRIWSAGCCTGEEPYSIAILLDQLLADHTDWQITILATDINPHSLQKASEGVYGDWSFRETSPSIRERYFVKKTNRFEILPRIRRMVNFAYLNLAEDAFPSLLNNTNAMDLIFCRNVLMYFAPEHARRAIGNFHRALVEGGWLVVSPSEACSTLLSPFLAVNFGNLIVYQKSADERRARETLAVGPHEEVRFPLLPDLVSSRTEFPLPSPPEVAVSPDFGLSEPESAAADEDPYLQAVQLFQQGRYSEAEELATTFLSEGEDALTTALLARIRANQGRLGEALECCEKAIALDKLRPDFRYLRALVLLEKGLARPAEMSLKKALYLNPDFVLAHFALGSLCQREGRLPESEKYFGNALSLLRAHRPDEVLPESEGMTAGRMVEVIRSMARKDLAA